MAATAQRPASAGGSGRGRRGGPKKPRLLRLVDAPWSQGEDYFDVETALARLEQGKPVAFPAFELVHWGGLTFALNYARDPIQNALRNGRFYERDELAAIAQLVGPGAHVLDIGSNIGNHALFFATRMKAARVTVIEPNPLAIAPLLANVVVNRLQDVICTDLLGIGLADRSEDGFIIRRQQRNLGATRMRKAEEKAVEDDPREQTGFAVHAGDDLFAEESPDFIKIDVEGMEMRVLAGLAKTIARCRPPMLIEVEEICRAAFDGWLEGNGYERLQEWLVGDKRANHLIAPLNGRARDDLANGKDVLC